MKWIWIIILVVVVAGLVLGFTPQSVWEYLHGLFMEFFKWFGDMLKAFVDGLKDSVGSTSSSVTSSDIASPIIL